jgi:cysteine-rich repeat protein
MRRYNPVCSWAALLIAACNGDGGGSGSTMLTTSGPSSTTAALTSSTTDASTSNGGPTSTGTSTSTGATSSPTGTTTGDSETATSESGTMPPTCGDGAVDMGEECDAGPANSDSGACTLGCKNAVCGDALLGPGEGCDDGNDNDADACSNACALASCGDGAVQEGELCDDGNADDTDACLASCVAASCGDGKLQAGVEVCDDGDADDTNACTSLCLAPACDDAIKSGDESDVDCGGACGPCDVDAACVALADCKSGFCDAGKCTIAAHCAAIKAAAPDALSGVFTIDPDGDAGEAPFDAYCDMTTDGGGWTLVLNLDTSDGHVMWWGNPQWTDGTSHGTAATARTADHVSVGWKNYAGAKEILLMIHNEGKTTGWRSFTKLTPEPMLTHVNGGDNVMIGTDKSNNIAGVWVGERLVRISTALYANRCVTTGGSCTSGSTGSPDGDRIGSIQASPSDNVGGGLGNWHDMNYCCNGNYGSGKVCTGGAFRTASEAQSGWAPCYGGNGHFGTDTFAPSQNTCTNANCAVASWSQTNGLTYDYSLMLR